MQTKLLTLLFPALLFSSDLFEEDFLDEIDYLQEETFVLSASRIKENINKTTSSVTVIDSDMIESMGANNILDVLITVPGIGITQSNIQAREIESRGIKDRSSKQVLFMLDGHPLDANLINGGSIWSLDTLNLDYISRIEIIKGPASSLYGSSAFVALVNIITKKADDIDGMVLRARYASNNTKETNILFAKQYDELSLLANLNLYTTSGKSVYVEQDRSKNSGYTNPWGRRFKVNLKLDYKDFYFSSLYSQREDGQYFGAVGNINDEDHHQNYQYFLELGYKKDITDKLNISSKIYRDKIRVAIAWELFSEGYPGKVFADGMRTTNAISNEKTGVEFIATYKFRTDLTTIFGATYENHKQYDATTIRNFGGNPPKLKPLNGMIDFTNTDENFAPNMSRYMKAGYINNLYDITKDIRITLGARYDSYTNLGSNVALRGGASWQINDSNTLKFMYGEGFRVPMFAELYNKHILTRGNPNLMSETVKTTEITLKTKVNEKLSTKVTLFNNDFKNLITKVITPSVSRYENIGDVNTRGLELELNYKLPKGSYLKANYTYQKAIDNITNQELSDVAKHKGNIILNYKVNRYVSVFNHLFIKGATQRVASDPRGATKGYKVLNTTVKIDNLYDNLELKFAVNNLFDAKAYDPAINNFVYDDYETHQRNISFEIQYKF